MTVSNAEKARRAKAAAAKAAGKSEAPPASSEKTTIDHATSPTGPKIKPTSEDNPLGAKIRKPEAPMVHDNKIAGGGRSVVVVLKFPRGLYLQLTEFVVQDVRVVGGGVEKRRQPMRVGPQIRLKPCVLPFGTVPNYLIIEGFSLTTGIDANFWNQYYQQNKELELITAGLLCAFDNEEDARAYCREYGKLKHGLEPLAQKDDPRIGSSDNPHLTDIDIDSDTPRPKA